MAKLVIITADLEDAEAALKYLSAMIIPPNPTNHVKNVLAFNAKLHKAIEHTKGVKKRV